MELLFIVFWLVFSKRSFASVSKSTEDHVSNNFSAHLRLKLSLSFLGKIEGMSHIEIISLVETNMHDCDCRSTKIN